MVQVVATIFFSAAALGALAVIVSTIADNFADVRRALVGETLLPPLPSGRVRTRRADGVRAPAMAPGSGRPQRAAA